MKCTCGSGAHSRECTVHPENYTKHVAELQRENDELLTDEERDALSMVASRAKPAQVSVVTSTWFDHNGRAWTWAGSASSGEARRLSLLTPPETA
jgi:hypothetical protein